jgi:hypothetical protein
MAVKVYIDGDVVIVDNGTAQVNTIRLDSFFFDQNVDTETVYIRDTDDDYNLKVLAADMQDQAGTPIGTFADVVTYLKGFITAGTATPLPTGAATEATLLSILNNMIASQDIEILLVADDGNGGQIVQQIREYDQGTGVWTTRYEDVNGVAYVPVGPLRYLDASAVLNLILTELLDQGLSLDTLVTVLNQVQTNTLNTVNELTTANVTLNDIEGELISLNSTAGTLATQATLELVRLLLVSLDGKDFATELTLSGIKTQTDLLNFIATALEVNVTSSVLPTGAATEATLATLATEAKLEQVRALLATIDADTSNLDVALSTIATEATLELCRLLLVDLKTNTAGLATESTLELIRLLLVSIDSVDFATEGKLEQVRVLLSTIDADTGAIATSTASIDSLLTPATRTHNTVSDTGVGSVPAGSMCGSVINAGSSAGTWNGISLPAGVSIPWTQIGNRDTYGIINYDATGTTFIIEYTT